MPNELATIQPLALVQQSIEKGADYEQIKALMDLAERWEINQDKKAFKEAMVRFHKNAPRIDKDKDVSFGTTSYSHASLGNVAELIGKALAAVGISQGWSYKQDGASTTVTCTLSLGLYSESTSLTAGPDQSGGKNAIQAIISTKSYLERHTLTGITGMATNDQDDDGQGGKDLEHDKVVAESCAIIEASETLDDTQANFAQYFGIAEKQLDQKAILQYTAARDRRKIALETIENANFQAAFRECDTAAAFNAQIVPLMKEQPRLKIAAIIEAKKRGYRANKEEGIFEESSTTTAV